MRSRLLLLPVALLAAGCGGRGAAIPKSRLTVWFDWPAPNARVIPVASNSIHVKVTQSGEVVAEAVLAKPATTVSFPELPLGSVIVTASAQPNADGSGTAMATATVPATISVTTPASVALTMASTIDRLAITPNPINLALTGLFFRQLAVTAYNVNNAVVLMDPADLSFTTSNALLFNVSNTGLVYGLAVGTATVTATDATSGKFATATVKVTLN